MEEKKSIKHSEIVVFFSHIIGIPIEHSKVYENKLKEKGFDSVSNLIHFLVLDDVKDLMSTEDFNKIRDYFNNIEGHDKMNIVKVLMSEITSKLSKPYESLRSPPDLKALDLSDVNETVFEKLDTFEFEDTPYYSKFEQKYISIKDSLIQLSPIPIPFGKGSGSKVYLKMHAYTLAPIAITEESKENIQKELTVNLISRQLLSDSFKGDDIRCGVCPGNKCQVKATTALNERSEETQTSNKISPYLVTFYNAHLGEGSVCFLFEFMTNGNLSNLCKNGWVPTNYDLAVICYSVFSALSELHSKHIIHRDIKMQNILVSQNGCVKVADFGIVKIFELSSGEYATTFTGTVSYMSPERLKLKPYSYECDIWAFGMTMLRLCDFIYSTGKTVDQMFFGTEMSYWDLVESVITGKHLDNFIKEKVNGLNPEFKGMIMQCLDINPQNRPTAKELIKNSFISKHLGSIENLNDAANQPRLSHLPEHFHTREYINIIVEKIVGNIHDRHSFPDDLKVEQIWEEPNRRHLAITLGIDYEDLMTVMQNEVDRRKTFQKIK